LRDRRVPVGGEELGRQFRVARAGLLQAVGKPLDAERFRQCDRHVAFEIAAGMHGLIDHMPLERVLADCDDVRFPRYVARRVPGCTAFDQQRQIHFLKERVYFRTEIEVM
jgi:hypothetical protein